MMVGVALGQTVNPITWPEAVAASLVVVSVVLAFNAIRSFGSLRGLARTAGAVSYPLYLLHQLAGYVLIAQFMWLGAPPWAAIGLAIAIVVSVAYLVAVFAEPWLAKRLRWILNAGVDWLRKLRRKVVATT
jgi:peptidoglycan/LPS O-acetylase OafA/YrhL